MSSQVRTCLIVTVAIIAACGSQAPAEDLSSLQDLRQWTADIIRGEDNHSTAMLNSKDSGETTPSSIYQTFIQKSQLLLAQTGKLIEQRIGWLRPTSIKEQALVWIVISLALPWAFMGWLRPILKYNFRPVRWMIAGLWTSLALWIAWNSWGTASGIDQFTSTMLIGLPLLLMYFNCVISNVASQVKN